MYPGVEEEEHSPVLLLNLLNHFVDPAGRLRRKTERALLKVDCHTSELIKTMAETGRKTKMLLTVSQTFTLVDVAHC